MLAASRERPRPARSSTGIRSQYRGAAPPPRPQLRGRYAPQRQPERPLSLRPPATCSPAEVHHPAPWDHGSSTGPADSTGLLQVTGSCEVRGVRVYSAPPCPYRLPSLAPQWSRSRSRRHLRSVVSGSSSATRVVEPSRGCLVGRAYSSGRVATRSASRSLPCARSAPSVSRWARSSSGLQRPKTKVDGHCSMRARPAGSRSGGRRSSNSSAVARNAPGVSVL